MAAVPGTAETADLRPATVEAFQRYVQVVEARIEERVAGGTNFLWVDDIPARRVRVGQGEVVTERAAGRNPVNVPDELIHDFIGAVVNDLPKESLAQTLAATRTGLLAGRAVP